MTGGAPRRSADVVVRRIAGESFIIPIRGHVADLRGLFALDPVGWFVWDRLDGKAGIAELAEAVAGEFEVDAETAARDVGELLESLRGHGCVESPA